MTTLPQITSENHTPVYDARPPVPSATPDLYVIRCWHWFADGYPEPRWGLMIFSQHDTPEKAERQAQTLIADGECNVEIVRIPGGVT